MSRPGPFAAETALQAPRRKPHVNPPGSDFRDPPHGDEAVIQAADRVLDAVQRFFDGRLTTGGLRLLNRRYRAELERAGLAPGSEHSTRRAESDG